MKLIPLAVATLCITALPLAAIAEKGGNKGGDRGNSAQAHADRDARGNNGNRGNGRGDGVLNPANGNSANARANPSQGFCPPGLRKKADGCVPPGQAANGVTAQEWAEQQGYRYYAGAELAPEDYSILENYADYDLPELEDGQVYAVINRTAVVIEEATGTLIRVATR